MLNVLLAGVGGQGTVLAAKILAQAAQTKGWQVRTAETIGMAQRGGNVTSHVRMGNLGEEVYAPLILPGSADVVIAFEPGEAARALPYVYTGIIRDTDEDGEIPKDLESVKSVERVENTHGAEEVNPENETEDSKISEDAEDIINAGSAKDSENLACAGRTNNAIGTGNFGRIITASSAIQPVTSALSARPYHGADVVEHLQSSLKAKGFPLSNLLVVDDKAIIESIGNPRVLNVVLLAYAVASGALPLTIDDLKEAVAQSVKPRFVDLNLKAIDTVQIG